MSDDLKRALKGLRVGDYHVTAVPVAQTSDALDTEANRERTRRAEEDEQAARFSSRDEGAGEAAQAAAEAVVEQAIEEGRARMRRDEVDDAPILLRDPVTGVTIEHG